MRGAEPGAGGRVRTCNVVVGMPWRDLSVLDWLEGVVEASELPVSKGEAVEAAKSARPSAVPSVAGCRNRSRAPQPARQPPPSERCQTSSSWRPADSGSSAAFACTVLISSPS